MSDLSVVGKPVPRVDTLQKASGKAVYTDDLRLPGMLYGRVLRSPFAHASLREIDVSGAYEVPGVKAVVTGSEFPCRQGLFIRDEPFLALDRVRYIGEAV